MDETNTPRGPLTPYEIAAITAGVPATEDPILNAIITTSLQYKTATELLAAYLASGSRAEPERMVEEALRNMSILMSRFKKREAPTPAEAPVNAEETQT